MALRFAPHISFGGLDKPLFAHSARSVDPVDQIRFAQGEGFAGVQDPFAAQRSSSEQSRIGEALAHHGLESGCFVYAPLDQLTTAWGSPDPAVRPDLMADIDRAIEIADRLHSRHIAIIGPADSDRPRSQQMEAMSENLRFVADRAERAGKILCLESLNARRLPSMLIHHILDAHAIVEKVASPAVRLIFDFGHVQAMDGDILHHLDLTWDAIELFQIADNPGRVEAGAGELNFVTIFAEIEKRGYSGLLELEHHWSKPGIEGEKAGLAMLRRIAAEATTD